MTKQVNAVGLIIENPKGQILVLKRHPDKPEGSLWGLPGGKIDAGEGAAAAASREAYEETGLRFAPATIESCKQYHWPREDMDLYFSTFRVSIHGEVPVRINPIEHVEYMWSMPDDLRARGDLMYGLYDILADTYNV